MADRGEIIVVPFQTSGHIYPAIELSKRLASRNYRITLLLPSEASDTSLHPLIRIVEFSMPHPPGGPPGPPRPSFSSSSSSSPSGTPSSFADFLARRFDGNDPSPRPICAIVDVMMGQLLDACREFQIPAVSFFTASACSTALDHATSKLLAEDSGPVSDRTVTIPGLPEEMALTPHDLKHRGHPPPGHAAHGGPPPNFGPGHGDVRPPGPHPPSGPGQFGGPPPPFRPGDGGAPPPPPGPGHHGGPPPPPPFGHGHCGGPPAPPTSTGGGPHPPPPFRPGDRGAPPPQPRPGHHGGPPPPPPFGHGHCGGPLAPPTSAGGGPYPPPPFRPGDGGAPPPPLGTGHHGGVPPPPDKTGSGDSGAPPPQPRPGHHGGPPPPPPFGHGHCGGPPAPSTSAGGGPCPPPPFRPGDGGAPPPPPGTGHHGGVPPSPDKTGPGGPFMMWSLGETNGAIALLFNTCDDLERPFLEYVAKEANKPVWGVGPLLPDAFWSAAESLVRDEEIRPKRDGSGVSEREVLEWLDSKPRGSVIYVSFGSIVAPSEAELAALAAGLEESNRPFIWAFQPQAMLHDTEGIPVQTPGGWEPVGLASRVGGRGLVIRGWAPQLLILSHRATGGFLTHCGWNSTVEALGCGVPMLTWPVHGDQIHNAKLVTRRLRAGIALKSGSEPVSKDDVLRGIERLMAGEDGVKERAASARAIFAGGFPRTSSASLDAFLDFVKRHRPNTITGQSDN